MKDRGPASLAHTLDWGVLLAVLGALLVIAMLLDASWNVGRRQMENQSWAESRCEGVAPPGLADSAERSACLRRELGKSDLDAVTPQLLLCLLGLSLATAGIGLLIRRRRCLSAASMKSSESGPG